MEPDGGWDSDELKDIFSKTVPRDPDPSSQSTVPPTGTTTIDGNDDSGGRSIGTGGIAGITIGAVVVVVAVTISLLWLKRKQPKSLELPVTPGYQQPQELDTSDTTPHELDHADARPHELPDSRARRIHEME